MYAIQGDDESVSMFSNLALKSLDKTPQCDSLHTSFFRALLTMFRATF